MSPYRFLEMEFLGNSVLDWALALLAFLVTFLALPVLRGYIARYRRRTGHAEHVAALDLTAAVLSRTTRVFLWGIALWVGESLLTLPGRIDRFFVSGMLVLLWFQAGVWAMAGVGFWIDQKRTRAADRALAGSLDLVDFLLRVVIWAFVVLVALDNLQIEITPLIAGLGIGGIAVALAVQTVLGDLLASLSITLDRPFVIGDFLVVDKDMGSVEKIGIKSTRLRSIDGEQVIVSNADLLKARVHNFGRMYERRVLFNTEIRYETPREKLLKVTGVLEEAVRAQPGTRFDRSHFARYGEYALSFETVYYVLDGNYNRYMDIQQAINFRIHEEFERHGIAFSFRDRPVAVEARAPARSVSE